MFEQSRRETKSGIKFIFGHANKRGCGKMAPIPTFASPFGLSVPSHNSYYGKNESKKLYQHVQTKLGLKYVPRIFYFPISSGFIPRLLHSVDTSRKKYAAMSFNIKIRK